MNSYRELIEKRLAQPGITLEQRAELMSELRELEAQQLARESARGTTRLQSAPATSSFKHETESDRSGSDSRWSLGNDLRREQAGRPKYFNVIPATSERGRE